jgi:hypothetical protein
LCVIVVVKALHGRILDRSVHPFDLPVCLGMLHLGETMLNAVCFADPVEDVVEGISVTGSIGEMNAIVGEHRMDARSENSTDDLFENANLRFPSRERNGSTLPRFDPR